MTFEEARKLAKEYDFLRGQMNKNLDATIVAITILARGEDCQVKAFYYTNVSGVGHDPIEWYEDRKKFRPFKTEVHFRGKDEMATVMPINPGKLASGYPDDFLVRVNQFYTMRLLFTANGWEGDKWYQSLVDEIGEKIMLHYQ